MDLQNLTRVPAQFQLTDSGRNNNLNTIDYFARRLFTLVGCLLVPKLELGSE